jgi:hypothetical protein
MAFCTYCSTIPSKIFSTRREDQGYHDHHESLETLKNSAESGCAFCGLLVYSLDAYRGKWAAVARDYPGKVKDRYRLASTKFGAQQILFGYSQVGYLRGGCMPEEWSTLFDCQRRKVLIRPIGNEHPPKPYVDRNEILEYEAHLIQRWTDLCFEKHTTCGHDTLYLPNRVIDVGNSQNPVLCLTDSSEVDSPDHRYLALSHCWGLTMPASAKTTCANIKRHEETIGYNALPLTFRDFIDIARRLQVRWIWIDSLCIIQDSKEDWEKEAEQMSDIYSKSYLTIAASGSANGTEGCHVHHERRSYGPVDIACLEPNALGSTESIPSTRPFRVWARDPDPIMSVLQQNPLNQRGWTVQERELAPRVAHYSKDTIRWECCELAATLEFPCGDRLPFDAGRLFDGGSDARSPQFGNPHNDSKPLNAITKQTLAWFELVQRYTARSLTKQSDILPALSGIAQNIALKTSDRYVAGLWESYFAHCLLWAIAVRDKEPPKHSRPANYLAPTWSWASVCGPVEYLSSVNGYWHTFNANPDPAFLPDLIDISLSPSGVNPYGLLEGGYMKVRGKFQTAYSMKRQGTHQLYSVTPSTTPEKIGNIHYDVPLCSECAPPGRMEFLFLLCCMSSEKSADGSFQTHALALKPEGSDMVLGFELLRFMQTAATGGIEKFRRVGVAVHIAPSFWDKAFNLTVTVV